MSKHKEWINSLASLLWMSFVSSWNPSPFSDDLPCPSTNFMPPAGSFALLSGGQARVLRGGLCGMCPAYVWRAQNTGEHLNLWCYKDVRKQSRHVAWLKVTFANNNVWIKFIVLKQEFVKEARAKACHVSIEPLSGAKNHILKSYIFWIKMIHDKSHI